MNRRPGKRRIRIALLLLLAAGPVLAETVYVRTKHANLREGKTSAAAVVRRVEYGEPLEVLIAEPGFYRVRASGGESGWIASQWVSSEKPKRSEFLAKLGQAARAEDGKQVSYTAGSRGLAGEAKQYAEQKGTAEAASSVEWMEGVKISPEALDAFLREGRLGEYRE
jgi:uncharacterized protein YgiM (DUF1202 family)